MKENFGFEKVTTIVQDPRNAEVTNTQTTTYYTGIGLDPQNVRYARRGTVESEESRMVIFETDGNSRFIFKNKRIIYKLPTWAEGPDGYLQVTVLNSSDTNEDLKINEMVEIIASFSLPESDEQYGYDIKIAYSRDEGNS